MKARILRRPLAFSLLLVLVLLAFTFVGRLVFPRAPVGNISRLPRGAFEPPSALDRLLDAVKNPDALFWALAVLLAAALLTRLGWWREAGFTRPSRWRNLRLLVFPLLVVALVVSGGVFVSGPGDLISTLLAVLAAVFAEELIFRGLAFRALAPGGPVRAVILTSLLSGLLVFGRTITDGPWPEAARVTLLAVCGGLTYGALRWRTASIWPVFLVHAALALAVDIATLGTLTYPLFLVLSTLGFVLYGLFLLRNPRARADGGTVAREPTRVR